MNFQYLYLSALQVCALLASFVAQILIAQRIGPSLALDAYFSVTGFALTFLGCVASGVFYRLPSVISSAEKSGFGQADMAGNGLVAAFVLGLITGITSLVIFIAGVISIQKGSGVEYDGLLIFLGWLVAYFSLLVTAWGTVGNSQGKAAGVIVLSIVPYAVTGGYFLLEPLPNVVGLASSQLLGNGVQICGLALLYRRFWTFRALDGRMIGRMLRSLPIAAAGALCFSGYSAVDAWLAPILGPETLSHQSFAQRLIIAFGAVLSVGPFMLSSNVTASMLKDNRLKDILMFCLKTAVALVFSCLIASAMTPSLGKWVISLFFERGFFDQNDTDAVATNVAILLIGAGPMLSTTIMFRVLHNLGSERGIAVLGVAWILLYASCAYLSSPWFGSLTLSVSYVISWWLVALATVFFLVRVLDDAPPYRRMP